MSHLGQDTSWLDAVPGGRAAYDYVRTQLSKFNLIGLQDVPNRERLLQFLGDRVRIVGDAALQRVYDDAAQGVAVLKTNFAALDVKLRGLFDQLRSVGLGQVPWVAITAILGGMITVAGALTLFFSYNDRNESVIRDLCDRSVERGIMTPQQCASMLRSGSLGGGLGTLGGGLMMLALVGGLIYFLPRRRAA